MERTDHSGLSRRDVLTTLGVLVGAPLILGGCGGDDTDPTVSTPPAGAGTPQAEDDVARSTVPRPRLPVAEPEVRVRVKTVRKRGERFRLGGDHWIRLTDVNDPRRGEMIRGPITVEASPDRWTIMDRGGRRSRIDHHEPIELEPGEESVSALALDEGLLPGTVRLHARSDQGAGALDVINHVGLESYLPGVVSKELFTHWHLEAFMAQAVAARSFAAAEHAYFMGRRHYDMTASASSQVYAGRSTHRNAVDAVAMTRGQMLSYRDYLVPGYYSSCCGGVSARALDAIGKNPINDLRPLDGFGNEDACKHAPVFSWKVERTADALSRRLVAWGRRRGRKSLATLTRVEAIEVAAANLHGRPTRFTVRDDNDASVELSAGDLRRAVNAAVGSMPAPRRTLLSSNVRTTRDGGSMVFDGNGFGHGVGLCQYGTEARARDGEQHRSILEFYYPEVVIRTAYI